MRTVVRADIEMARKLHFGRDALAELPATGDDKAPQLVMQLHMQRDITVVIEADLIEFFWHKGWRAQKHF